MFTHFSFAVGLFFFWGQQKNKNDILGHHIYFELSSNNIAQKIYLDFLGSSKSSLREEFSFAYNEEGYKQTKK